MKSKLILSFVLTLFLLSFASAFFVESHTKWTLQGFGEVNSPITQKCEPYIDLVLDGDTSSDMGVLHYGSNNLITSYIYPHTKGGHLSCLREAGADIEKQCFCYGNALHVIQDSYSHNENGIVTKTLKKYLGTNYFGHMSVERDFENKHMELIQKDDAVLYSKITSYNGRLLNSLFPELGGDNKFLLLANQVAGIDMTTDAKIFRSGYIGEGFYSTVYKDKVNLPYWAISIPIILIALSLVVIFILLRFGTTGWRWMTSFIWLLIMIVGIVIIVSFYTGTTWKLTTFVIEIPPMFGYLSVSQQDIITYDNAIQQATNKFLETGELTIQDASGLSYTDASTGQKTVGELTKAERGSKYIVLPLMLIVIGGFMVFLFLKSFGYLQRKRQ